MEVFMGHEQQKTAGAVHERSGTGSQSAPSIRLP
jgi:hypothetical protein